MFQLVSRICALALTHHFVDLFESQASCLRHEEVRPEDTAGAESTPDEEYFGSEATIGWIDHIGYDDTCSRH